MRLVGDQWPSWLTQTRFTPQVTLRRRARSVVKQLAEIDAQRDKLARDYEAACAALEARHVEVNEAWREIDVVASRLRIDVDEVAMR